MESLLKPQICYRVGEKIFDTIEDAQQCCDQQNSQRNTTDTKVELINQFKKNLVEKISKYYTQHNIQTNQCNCDGRYYSDNCLLHLCTCDLFDKLFPEKEFDQLVCNYHTNVGFRNKGCYWCKNSDCSKNHC